MMDLQIALSQADIQHVSGSLRLTPKMVRAAALRAIRKTARSTEVQTRRKLSSELRIAARLIRARLRLYRKNDALTQKVWLGLNAVAVARLGQVQRMPGGARIGRHFFKDGFAIAKYGGGVYRRTGRARFPLEMVKLEIEDAGHEAMEAAAQDAEKRLMQFLHQEMRYELSKLNAKG